MSVPSGSHHHCKWDLDMLLDVLNGSVFFSHWKTDQWPLEPSCLLDILPFLIPCSELNSSQSSNSSSFPDMQAHHCFRLFGAKLTLMAELDKRPNSTTQVTLDHTMYSIPHLKQVPTL